MIEGVGEKKVDSGQWTWKYARTLALARNASVLRDGRWIVNGV
jgi:hypothetical protein